MSPAIPATQMANEVEDASKTDGQKDEVIH